MFGFSWGEIGIILAVALIFIGPKDLPVAIRTVTGLIKKARGMAAEFQGHVDDMMREVNIADVTGDIKKAANFGRNLPAAMAKTLDPDGSLRAGVDAAVANVTGPAVPGEVVEEQNPATPRFIPPGTRRWGF